MFDYIKKLGKDKLNFLNQSTQEQEQEEDSREGKENELRSETPPNFNNYNNNYNNNNSLEDSIRPISSSSSSNSTTTTTRTKLNKYQQARRRQQIQSRVVEEEEYDPYRISEVEKDYYRQQQQQQQQPLYQSTPPPTTTRRNVGETSIGLGLGVQDNTTTRIIGIGIKGRRNEIDSIRRRGYRVNQNQNQNQNHYNDNSQQFEDEGQEEEEEGEEEEEFLRNNSIINRSGGGGGNVFDGTYNYPEEDQLQQQNYSVNEEEEYEEYERPPSAYRPRSQPHPSSHQHKNMYSTTEPYGQRSNEDEEKGNDGNEEEEISYDAIDWNEKDNALDETNDLESDWIPATPASLFLGGFGAPPQTAQLRRNRTNRRVKLTAGNLVLDCAIPTRLMSFLPRKEGNEFKYTRYTAVTCGPDEFDLNRFTLRPTLYNRQTELLIVVTLYNENEVLFCRTLHGVMKNIAHLCTRNKSKTWGKDGWKKVVVCIVADGRRAINPRILDCLSALGVYQEGMAKNVIDNKKVEAHIYEYTTQLSIDPELKFKGMEKGIVPTQIMFCLKESKLNSHRWALQAFAPQLDPNIVILLDVGTKPGPKSLYYLWKTFDLNSNVGGACGEICAMKGKVWQGLFNPLVAAQNFEYKMSNILDKPTESVFGYITVLPGAFSAYRYIALKNDALGHGPLNSYFKGEHLAGYDADVFTSNMYLAEDRILCWELVAKAGHAWVLKFVKSAQAETDVPDQIAEFISQRRRWLNGSFFAGTYALTHTMQLLKTEHSLGKKVALVVQAFYNLVNLMFSWFGIGNYWIFFMVLTTSLEDPSFNLKGIQVANAIIQYLYMGTVVACFLFAMGNRPQGSKWKYLFAMIIFAFTTAYMLGAAAFAVLRAVKGSSGSLIYAQIVISLLATYGTYIISSVLALDPWHLVTSMPQYMLFAPIYINLLNIFAFSNLHDFSWGTKEQTSSEVDLGVAASAGKDTVDITLPSAQADIDGAYDEALHKLKTRPMIVPRTRTFAEKQATVMDYYKNVRTNVLLAWTLSNALLVTTILQGDYSSTFSAGGGNGRTQEYLVIILVFVALMAVIRLAGSTTYLVARLFSG